MKSNAVTKGRAILWMIIWIALTFLLVSMEARAEDYRYSASWDYYYTSSDVQMRTPMTNEDDPRGAYIRNSITPYQGSQSRLATWYSNSRVSIGGTVTPEYKSVVSLLRQYSGSPQLLSDSVSIYSSTQYRYNVQFEVAKHKFGGYVENSQDNYNWQSLNPTYGYVTLYDYIAGKTYWVDTDPNNTTRSITKQSNFYRQPVFYDTVYVPSAEYVQYLHYGVVTITGKTYFRVVPIPAKCILSYNLNGGSGSIPSESINKGYSLSVTGDVPVREGYKFRYWTTNKDGTGTVYRAGNSIVMNSNITLYAQWLPLYTLSYNLNGGHGDSSFAPVSDAKGTVLKISGVEPTKTNYDFVGWYTNSLLTGIKYSPNGSITLNSNITLYAKWKIKEFNITYDLDGGTVSKSNPTKYTPETNTFTLNNPTRENYEFLGWIGSNGPTPQKTVTIPKGTTGDLAYTAVWQKTLFHIDFNLNIPGGYESMPVSGMSGYTNGKDAYYNQAYGYLPGKGNNNWPTPSVERLSFLGWYTAPYGGTKISASTKFNQLSDVTLYAQWKKDLSLETSVNLTYNAHIINGVTFRKGGVDLDWSSHLGTTGFYNSYMRKYGSSSWTMTQRKVKTKTYANTKAIDTAAPNSISQSSVELIDSGTTTKVTFDKPSDNGTAYEFYVDENEYPAITTPPWKINYSSGVQSFTAPMEGIYKLTLYGGASGSGQKGAKVTGSIELKAGQTIYIVTGGKGAALSGGYNGGGLGGGPGAYGGGGATQVTTTNRGLLSNYNSYRTEVIAVAGGAGGNGGNGTAFVYWADLYGTHTSIGGSGGNSGANGGGSTSTYSNNGNPETGSGRVIGGFGGRIPTGGTNTTYNPNADIFWGAGQIMSGNGSSITTGSGGGGGAGWSGGGGGSSGWAFGTGSWSNSSGGYVHKRPKAGENGAFGKGGNGGAGTSYSANGDSEDRTKRSPFASSGGGGGAGGSSYTGGLTGASTANGVNAGDGYVVIELTEILLGESVADSNIAKETVTTGIKGYRYLVDTSASTKLAATSGSFTTSTSITVTNRNYAQYLHIAPQDGAGNIGETIHIPIKPIYSIKYDLDGGTVSPSNPTQYTPSDPTFTLNNPTQNGYVFIGWTGSNGTVPELTVTIPKGSAGDRSYKANWIKNTAYVSGFTVYGDLYNYGARQYYVKPGTDFRLSFSSWIVDKAGKVVGSSSYGVTNNLVHVKNGSGEHVQTRDHELGMAQTSGGTASWQLNNQNVLNVLSSVAMTRTTTPLGATSGWLYYNTSMWSELQNHGDVAVAYPQSSLTLSGVSIKSSQFDESKSVTVRADGEAPEIRDNIINDEVYTEGNIPISVEVDDADSGIESIKIELENLDSGYSEVLYEKENSTRVTENSFSKTLDGKDKKYAGEIVIRITSTDNVGNTSTVEKTLVSITLDASVKRVLPSVDKNGNTIPDNVFKEGEQGYLVIKTTGYVEQIDIVFDNDMKEAASIHGYEIADDVIVSLPNNGENKNENFVNVPVSDLDELKPVRMDNYFFYVPIGVFVEDADDPDDNRHYIIIRAHKGDKEVSNVLDIGVGGDDYTTDDDIIIDDGIQGELRTRIRERGN